MKKFRNVPALITLLAGFVTSVLMIINRIPIVTFLWTLALVMVGFFFVRAMALGCNTSGVYHMSGKCWMMSTKDIKCDSFFDSMEDDFHKCVKSVICKDKRFR